MNTEPQLHLTDRPVVSMSTLGQKGRFGNQLLQYGFLRLYALKHHFRIETPPWVGQTLFGHRDLPLSQDYPIVPENPQENWLETVSPPHQNVDFNGFFHYPTQTYQADRELWQSFFEPIPSIRDRLEIGLQRLRERGNTILGLHLRRGDFGYGHFFIAPTTWYKTWLATLWPTLDRPVLFIASDDLDRVLPDFADYAPCTSRELGITLPEAEFYPDFYYLSHCQILAISNSSFSFTAAMLNRVGQQFMRPHLPSQQLIPFDPWCSEILLKDQLDSDTVYQHFQEQRRQHSEQWLTTDLTQLTPQTLESRILLQRTLLNQDLRYFPIPLPEQQWVETLYQQFAKTPGQLALFLALMPYYFAYQLPRQWFQSLTIPDWFIQDYSIYLLESPRFFLTPEESDRYLIFLDEVLTDLEKRWSCEFPPLTDDRFFQTFVWQKNFVAPTFYLHPDSLASIYSRWTAIVEMGLQQFGSLDHWSGTRPSQRTRIHVGILQPLLESETGVRLILPLLEGLDRTQFKQIIYIQTPPHPDLQRYCDHWVTLPQNLEDSISLIRQADLDILLICPNLAISQPPLSLLVMHRLARVQVAFVSTSVSVGMSQIDYYTAGQLTLPLPSVFTQESSQGAEERWVTIPGSGYCLSQEESTATSQSEDKQPTPHPSQEGNPRGMISGSDRDRLGIPEESIILIAGGNGRAITPEVRQTWVSILAAIPKALLLLYHGAHDSFPYPIAALRQQFQTQLSQVGLNPSQVVILEPGDRTPLQSYLDLADFALGTYPVDDGVSLLERLQRGLPCVVLEGETRRSRQTAALLRELGLPELVTETVEDYQRLAIALGTQTEFRQYCRQLVEQKLRDRPGIWEAETYAAQWGLLFQQFLQEWESASVQLDDIFEQWL